MKTSELLREIANHRLAASGKQYVSDPNLFYTIAISLPFGALCVEDVAEIDRNAEKISPLEEMQAIRFMGLHFLAHMYEDEGD